MSQFEIDTVVVNERLDRFGIGEAGSELPVAGNLIDDDNKIVLWCDYIDMGSDQRQIADLTAA